MSKFNLWVDDVNVAANTLDLSEDSQRSAGFQSGSAASSKRVNSMFRQNSLVVKSLMDIFDVEDTLTYASSVDAVKSTMLSYFNKKLDASTFSGRKVAGFPLSSDVVLGKFRVQLLGVNQGEAYDGSKDVTINFDSIVDKSSTQDISGFKSFTNGIEFKTATLPNSNTQIGGNCVLNFLSNTSDTSTQTLPAESGTLINDKTEKKYYEHSFMLFQSDSELGYLKFSIICTAEKRTFSTLADLGDFVYENTGGNAGNFIYAGGEYRPTSGGIEEIVSVFSTGEDLWVNHYSRGGLVGMGTSEFTANMNTMQYACRLII